MAVHAKFSPSKSQQLIACRASYALQHDLPDNRSEYADDGTGAHHVASVCLLNGDDASYYIGNSFDVDEHGEVTIRAADKGKFKIDATWAADLQVYIDEVRRRSFGKKLLVEQRVEFSESVNVPDQFGTSDCIIIDVPNKTLEIGDLKFGQGVKVYAERNEQMMTYAGAVLETFAESLPEITKIKLFISQPRIDWFDEWECAIEDIQKHMVTYRSAINEAQIALRLYTNNGDLRPEFFGPGEKQCRFCKAEAFCPVKRQWVAESVIGDFKAFETEQSIQQVIAGPPLRVSSPSVLGQLYGILDQVESWCKSVRSETERLVMAGTDVIGPDGLRMKVGEGKKGNRAWSDEQQAEALLAGQLPPEKIYKPRQIISVSEAGKLLDKKKTAATWDMFKPLIKQSPGRPIVMLGSDPRPEWKGEAKTSEFAEFSDDPTA